MRIGWIGLVLGVGVGVGVGVGAGVAVADPKPAPAPAPAPSSSMLPPAVLLLPPTPQPVPSLRIEAARVASEQFDSSWRYPEVGPLFGVDGGLWFVGHGRYRPRSARSAALHGGSIAATLVGEILLAADSPLAGVGAMITGATLDAAAAEADGSAEARR